MRVLVVEDEPELRRVVAQALREEGYAVDEAAEGQDGYNRQGGEIHVRLATDAATVILTVTDTGCGISEEDQALLFERFYRADKSRARTSGGHGLGLAICKSIVEAHGGTIDFTTERDQGTTFRVILPRADSVSAATP